MYRFLFSVLVATVAGIPVADPVSAQAARPPFVTEQVRFTNPQDGTSIGGVLTLPSGGPARVGVVLHTLAATDDLIDELTGHGYAVLQPQRRGLTSVEPLLQATFEDLADDVQAAIDYLWSRPEVGDAPVAIIAQYDDTQAALLAAVEASVPLVLLSAPAFSGTQTFQLEQRSVGASRGYSAEALDALDVYVDQLTTIVLSERSPALREYRLRAFFDEAGVRLPRAVNFTLTEEGQIHFLTSPWFYARFAFQPVEVVAQLTAPTLVLIGLDDPSTALERYLPTMRSALEAAPSRQAKLCLVAGRTRHGFSPVVVEVISQFLTGSPTWAAGRCLPDPPAVG